MIERGIFHKRLAGLPLYELNQVVLWQSDFDLMVNDTRSFGTLVRHSPVKGHTIEAFDDQPKRHHHFLRHKQHL